MKKQRSGLYRTKVTLGIGADGKPIYKYISGKTKAELEAARRQVVEHYITGDALKADRLFGEYATEWYRVRKAPFIAPSTVASYRSMLNRHILPAFGDRNLRAIRPLELQAFLNGFAGASGTQITLCMTVLKAIFQSACRDQLLRTDPTADLIRPDATPAEERRALTPEERGRVVEVIRSHPEGLYLGLLYYTGMRPGEVRGLRWGDVDWDTGLIHVQRDLDFMTGDLGELKTRAADRFVPLADPLRALLWPLRQAPAALILSARGGKPLSQNSSRRMWLRLMIACGLADEIEDAAPTCYGRSDILGLYRPRITPHYLRHNFITMCWERGVDILVTMKAVGHADYQTTRNIYTHLDAHHMDIAKKQINGMFESESCTKVAQLPHNA